MDYQVVTLKEKIVVGVSAVTSNSDPKMTETIENLWSKLYQEGVHESIKNKLNDYAIGLYSEYEGENYCVTAGNEVSKAENEELSVKVIPPGKYAKFSVHGHMQTAVVEAWNVIWQMDLDRSFTGDFEEYLNDDFENADIDIYVALRS
ncbi:GyrI-like domain-containing protein [Aminipila sp.]|uniref:GyrI-like domain-containing protein n=1 Tax=Aminipila sp. TaxID=2060095 RepID=UPI001E1015AB|nr:GyrI-like domain-containing protein [Aminipila sp.]MBE6034790.1 AraC family transcriptional regulator [Clostridiales bacterium]